MCSLPLYWHQLGLHHVMYYYTALEEENVHFMALSCKKQYFISLF